MSKRLTRRVLLIGWDAADWHIIHPLMEAGKMPVLRRLVEFGTSGKISTRAADPLTDAVEFHCHGQTGG